MAHVSGALRVVVDKADFAMRYEASLLLLEQLTPHQHEAVGVIRGQPHVLLEAPAGGGKTFVAMALMLEELLASEVDAGDVGRSVLFACWSAPLCYFVCRWVCKRVPEPGARRLALSRLHVLFHPMSDGPRSVNLDEGSGILVCTPTTPSAPFTLLVVDEAHHVYTEPALQYEVERLVVPGRTRRLLLSDVSQSHGRSIPFPTGLERVQLTEASHAHADARTRRDRRAWSAMPVCMSMPINLGTWAHVHTCPGGALLEANRGGGDGLPTGRRAKATHSLPP